MMFRFTLEGSTLRSGLFSFMLLGAMLCANTAVMAQATDEDGSATEEEIVTETSTTSSTGDIEELRNKNAGTGNLTDFTPLEGFVQGDKTLSGGTYLVQHNIKINQGAILTIEAGTELVFDPGTSIVVEGGLRVNGEANNFVTFRSRYPDSQGGGILIRGREGSDIDINFADFVALQMPLNFDMDWYRGVVSVTNSTFRDMNTGESNVLIISPMSSLYTQADKKTLFTFSRNSFINNWGSIYIENLQDDVLDLRFTDNLITNNVVYGLDKGIPSNTPVFGYYDNSDKRFRAQISGNSIYGNYQINAATDTVIREISLGIQGEGESFDIPNNYFRSTDPEYVSSTLDHFYQNNSLPLLRPKPVLREPSPNVPGHIYRVFIGDEEVTNYSETPKNLNNTNVTFRVMFNRPVEEFGETQLESVFYDTINNGIRIDPVDFTSNGEWSADKKTYTFTVADASFLNNDLGYVIIKNFKDSDGFIVPSFTIGQRKAINTYSKLYNAGVASTYFPPAEVINNPGGFVPDAQDLEVLEELSELGDLSYLGAYTSLAKTWEVGLLAGTMNYMGDLQTNLMDKDDFRWGFGVFGQYNISKWFSTRLTYNYGRVTGSDLDESELGRQRRVANFRSDIHNGELTMHFHLLQYGISKGEKFSPSIFVGVGMFSFNPQARIFTGLNGQGEATYLTFIDGVFEASSTEEANRGDYVWVPLQQIGTQGETTNITDIGKDGSGNTIYERDPPKQYKKWNLSIPFGVSFDFIINKSWVIGIEGAFKLTFTDRLDDISGFYWDRGISPADVNGDGTTDGLHPHASIIEANNDGISGRLGGFRGEQVQLDPYTRVYTSEGSVSDPVFVYVPTAALLANPSLANAVSRNPDNIEDEYDYVINQNLNDANTFPSARKGDDNRDWFNYFGIKVSKVLGYKRKNRGSAENKTLTDY